MNHYPYKIVNDIKKKVVLPVRKENDFYHNFQNCELEGDEAVRKTGEGNLDIDLFMKDKGENEKKELEDSENGRADQKYIIKESFFVDFVDISRIPLYNENYINAN